MSHFSVIVRGTGQVFAGGPPVVKRGIGQDIDKETLGGADVHRGSGVVTNEARSEDDAFAAGAAVPFLPARQRLGRAETRPARRPGARCRRVARHRDARGPAQGLRHPRKILQAVFDAGSAVRTGPPFGGSIVTMLARLDGYAVGVVANDPRVMGGALTLAAARKLERFVDLCDTFHLPIVNLVDQPGVMFGPDAEKPARWRRRCGRSRDRAGPGALVLGHHPPRLRRGRADARPPARTRWHSLNHRFAWPRARWGSIPIEGGVAAAYRQEIADAAEPAERRPSSRRTTTAELAVPHRRALRHRRHHPTERNAQGVVRLGAGRFRALARATRSAVADDALTGCDGFNPGGDRR